MTKALLVLASVAAVITGITVMMEYRAEWFDAFIFIEMFLLGLAVFAYLCASYALWEERKIGSTYYSCIRKDSVIHPKMNFAFALFSFPQFIAIAVYISLHYPKWAAPTVLIFSLITVLTIYNLKIARRAYES